jgi:hypothetical protein
VRLRLNRREVLLLSLLAVAGVVVLWSLFQRSGTGPAVLTRSRPEVPLPAVPRIDLARLEEPRTDVEVGRRDLFAYGPPEGSDYEPQFRPPPRATPTVASPASARSSREGAALSPMNLKFIGSVGNAEGVKVAVLVTERNEVLTGQRGDVVANRYRIANIGIESVDLEDVGTGQSRRIPLKGN